MSFGTRLNHHYSGQGENKRKEVFFVQGKRGGINRVNSKPEPLKEGGRGITFGDPCMRGLEAKINWPGYRPPIFHPVCFRKQACAAARMKMAPPKAWATYFLLRGDRGIRTLDTLWGYTHFPGVPLQPLEQVSVRFLRVAKILLQEEKANNFSAFFVVMAATSLSGQFLSRASFSTTYFRYAGSLRFPRNGTGAR